MSASERAVRRRTAVASWLVLTAMLVGAGSFVLGRKWPIETITRVFADRAVALPPEWSTFAQSDLPRYEMIRVRDGATLYLFGGFYSAKIEATPRSESLDLTTGKWTRLTDMPVALTHATAAIVRDTVWIAGGFEGNHPGPATARVWRYSVTGNAWSQGPSLPQPRGGGALVADGEVLHYFGGYLPDRNTNSSEHWTLRVGDSEWKTAANLPDARGHLSGIVLAGRAYAVGGAHGHDPIPIDVDAVHRYDLAADAWELAPSLPMPLSHTEPSTTEYDGRLLSAGGRSRPSQRENADDILLFDPTTTRWTNLGRTPMPMLGGLAVVLGDTLFAGLGSAVGANPQNPLVWRRTLRNHWWEGRPLPEAVGEVAAGVIDNALLVVGEGSKATMRYDLAQGAWHVLSASARPASGSHHAAEVVNGLLFLLGGFGGGSEGLVQILNPRQGVWRLGPRMPFNAGSSASAHIDGKIYVAGGIVDSSTTAAAAVLDLSSMTWSAIAAMPLPRNHAASATDGRKFYVFGGRGPGSGDANVVANGFDDVQIYDPATNTWRVSDGAPGSPVRVPVARGGAGKAVYVDGEFWILGGETKSAAGASTTNTFARVDIYDPVLNRWRVGPSLPTARHGIFPVASNGMIMVAGGGAVAGYGNSSVLEMIWPRR